MKFFLGVYVWSFRFGILNLFGIWRLRFEILKSRAINTNVGVINL